MTSVRRGMVLMAVFAALWAAIEALGAHLHRSYSPYQVVFTRYLAHLALMLAVWGWREPSSLWRTARPVYQLLRSALMICMPVAFITALRLGLPAATVFAVFWTAPLITLGLARLLLGERARWPAWTAAALASLGAAASLASGVPALPLPALLCAVAMAASFSLYVVMTRSLRTETTRANLFYTAAGVAAVLAFAMPRLWVPPSPHDAAVMAGIGLVGWIALWALDRMASLSPVSPSAPLACLYAAFSVGLEALATRRVPGLRVEAALSLVFLATGYLWAREPFLFSERAP